MCRERKRIKGILIENFEMDHLCKNINFKGKLIFTKKFKVVI